jgi:hypothetical protein
LRQFFLDALKERIADLLGMHVVTVRINLEGSAEAA